MGGSFNSPGNHLLLLNFRFQQARPPGVTGGSTKSPFPGRSGSGLRSQRYNQTTFKKPVLLSWLLVQVITQARFQPRDDLQALAQRQAENQTAAAWAARSCRAERVSSEALAKRCRRGVSVCSSDTCEPEQVDGTGPFTSCSARTFLLGAPSPAGPGVSWQLLLFPRVPGSRWEGLWPSRPILAAVTSLS